jgi:hypothetical protein
MPSPALRKVVVTPNHPTGVGAPAGFGFLRIGSPGSSQLVRIGADTSAARILIPTGA